MRRHLSWRAKSDGTECRFVKSDHGLFYLDAVAMTNGHSADHETACNQQAVEVQTGVRVDIASHVDEATVAGVDDEPTGMANEDADDNEDDSTYQQSSPMRRLI